MTLKICCVSLATADDVLTLSEAGAFEGVESVLRTIDRAFDATAERLARRFGQRSPSQPAPAFAA